MWSMSTGTAAMSRPICRDGDAGQAGFTLIEALVALALLLGYLSVLGPHLFHARRIADQLDGRIAAQIRLRAILDAPFDRMALAKGARDGETGGMRWSIAVEPMFVEAMLPRERDRVQVAAGRLEAAGTDAGKDDDSGRPRWTAFRLIAKVSWAPGRVVSAETLRLGVPE